MKFLLVLAAVAVLVWLWRSGRRIGRAAAPPQRPAASADAAQPMLACVQCGVHLPRDETLPGRGGVFCSAEHRAAFERAHPPS